MLYCCYLYLILYFISYYTIVLYLLYYNEGPGGAEVSVKFLFC